MKVVVDAGHGGKDPGATAGFYRECDQVLGVANRLANILEKREISVILTRKTDVFIPLERRTRIAKEQDGRNIFVSLHMNASVSRKGTGFESYIQKRAGKESVELQSGIHHYIEPILKKYNLKDRGKKRADFFVVRNSPEPSILLELLFIDADMEKIEGTNYYHEVATAIADAIEDHILFFSQRKEKRC